MKTILVTLLTVLLTFNSYAQRYSDLVAQAFSQLEQKNEAEFAKTYPELFSAYLKELSEEYQEALAASVQGNKGRAFELLQQLVADSTYLEEIRTEKGFAALHKDSRWKSLRSSIHKIEKGYNLPARKALLQISDRDQGIRLLVMEAYKKYGRESDEARKVRSTMKRVDAESAAGIQQVLDRYGWLSADEVGYFANQAYFLAVQHVGDAVVQQKYLPVLRKAVEAGSAKPWHYAFLQDRILMNQGKPQIYGTQKVVSDDPDKSYIIPLQDPDHVDSLRAEVGLGLLKDDLEEVGMRWDVEAYKRRLPEIERMYRERFRKQQAERETANQR
ncbi:DUF6624 domain-containing protein [Pontibacter actiniarum]|uniref:Uncharacterized protein n=1 Tax=Pontibacter actiniarum TaxID=323450 RepID=A0A1X9YV16_9BACT|nr:DUF6624 domain-containing protein [Pontibacter actiniarum]ARS36699.1 hypothetical protein CA264_15435 [Pontibacter actiniarum]